jgi:hypothetical protein
MNIRLVKKKLISNLLKNVFSSLVTQKLYVTWKWADPSDHAVEGAYGLDRSSIAVVGLNPTRKGMDFCPRLPVEWCPV